MKTNISIFKRLCCFGLVFLLSIGLNAGPNLDAKIQKYVDQYKDLAISESERTGIPASIKLAQAVLESRYGSSDLATKANNHFGIKCKVDWQGETVYAKDDTPSDCFRKYSSAHESFIDHSNFLKDHRLHFYDHLFEIDKRDYKAWASGLQIAGYASTNYYAKTLIYLIEKYEFYKFDDGEKFWSLSDDEQMALSTKAQNVYGLQINVPKPKPKEEVVEEPTYSRIHLLKEGESMESIAQQYEVNIDSFYNHNELIFGSQPVLGSILYLDAPTRQKPELNIIFYERTVVGGENTYSNNNLTETVSTPMTNTVSATKTMSTSSSSSQPEQANTEVVSSLEPMAKKASASNDQTRKIESSNTTEEKRNSQEESTTTPTATIDNSILDIVVSPNTIENTDSLTVPITEDQKTRIENIWYNQKERPKDQGTQ